MYKQEIQKLLGENAIIEITDNSNNVIFTIDSNTQFEEDGSITINYENEPENIIIKTSEVKNEGILNIEHIKEIKNTLPYQKDIKIKTTNQFNEIQKENIIDIKDSQTTVDLKIDNENWTNEEQNDVTFDIYLDASTVKNNMFKDPSFEINLPNQVEKIIIRNYSIFAENGLKLQEPYVEQNQYGMSKIKINLEGTQTQYYENNLDLLTDIKISATVILKKDIETENTNINLAYTNHYSVDGNAEEGNIEKNIKLENYIEEQVPESIVYKNIEPINTSIEGLEVQVAPMKGDANISNGDTIYEKEYIKYNVQITNTTENQMENVKIVGNVPEGTTYGELYAEHSVSVGKYEYHFDENVKTKEIEVGTLKPGETVNKFYEVRANELENNQQQKEITSHINVFIGETEASIFEIKNVIKPAQASIFLKSFVGETRDQWYYMYTIENAENKEVEVTLKVPEEYELQYFIINAKKIQPEEIATIQENNIIKIKSKTNEQYIVLGEMNRAKLAQNGKISSEEQLMTTASVEVDGVTYHANENIIFFSQEDVKITMESENEGEEVHYEEEVNYEITIENIGRTNADAPAYNSMNINVTDFLPEQLAPVSITYNNWKEKVTRN